MLIKISSFTIEFDTFGVARPMAVLSPGIYFFILWTCLFNANIHLSHFQKDTYVQKGQVAFPHCLLFIICFGSMHFMDKIMLTWFYGPVNS